MKNRWKKLICVSLLVSHLAHAGIKEQVTEGCLAAFDQVGRATRAVYKGVAKFSNRNRLTVSAYQELSRRSVHSFFPDGKVTEDGKKEFLRSYELLLKNFSYMYNGGINPRGIRRMTKAFKEEPAEPLRLLQMDVLQKYWDASLQDLFMGRYMEHMAPKDPTTLAAHIKDYSKTIAAFPFKWSLRKIQGAPAYVNDVFKVAVGGAVGLAFGLFFNPITERVGTFLNANFGDWGVSLGVLLSDVEKAADLKDKMSKIRDRMTEINQQYLTGSLSEQEATKLWDENEKLFFDFRNEWMATFTTQVTEGRSYFNESTINYPLQFSTALTSASAEKNLFEKDLREAKERRAAHTGDSSAIDKEIHDLEKQIKHAKERIGTIAGLWRVWQIWYPEVTASPDFAKKRPSSAPYADMYDKVMSGLHLEDYSTQYLAEMNRFLNSINLPEHGVKK